MTQVQKSIHKMSSIDLSILIQKPMVSRSLDLGIMIIHLEMKPKRYYTYPVKYDLLLEKILLGFFSKLQSLFIHLSE